MKAVRVHQIGPPEVMRLEELPTPEPAEGQVLVEVEAVGVNFLDVYRRSGQYPSSLPFTPGMEAAGYRPGRGPHRGRRASWRSRGLGGHTAGRWQR